MAQFARPDSDLNQGLNWVSTGSSFNSELDEVSSDQDTSMIWGFHNFTPDTFEVGLSNVTDPGVGTGHTFRVSAKDDTGLSDEFAATLKESGSPVASMIFGWGDDIWTTFAYTLAPAEANTITDYTALSIAVEGCSIGDISGTFMVSQVEFEVPGGGTAALTGTVTASITEADIVAGGKTAIITLTGDTFIVN